MQPEADAELVNQARSGDQRSFESLVLRHFSAVYVVAFAHVANRETAEDIAQEVFLRAYLHLEKLQKPSQFPAWVCRIARNLAVDWQRSPDSVARLIPRLPDSIEVDQIPDRRLEGAREKMAKQEQQRAVHDAMLKLPAELREVLLLQYCEGMNTTEIGERLGVHRTTIHYRLKNARTEFRRLIEPAIAESTAAAMRPDYSAHRRACGVVAVAGALSLVQKKALAMASAPSVNAATASLAIAPVATTMSGASVAVGGAAKPLMYAGLVLVLLSGGGFWYQHNRNTSPRVTLTATETPMEEVARQFSKQSGRAVLARGKTAATRVTFTGNSVKLEDALNGIRASQTNWLWVRTAGSGYEMWDAESFTSSTHHCDM